VVTIFLKGPSQAKPTEGSKPGHAGNDLKPQQRFPGSLQVAELREQLAARFWAIRAVSVVLAAKLTPSQRITSDANGSTW